MKRLFTLGVTACMLACSRRPAVIDTKIYFSGFESSSNTRRANAMGYEAGAEFCAKMRRSGRFASVICLKPGEIPAGDVGVLLRGAIIDGSLVVEALTSADPMPLFRSSYPYQGLLPDEIDRIVDDLYLKLKAVRPKFALGSDPRAN